MAGFSKVPCQPSMADPRLRPGGPLRDRRAGAQSHVRGCRSSCGPHLASSGAAAGGSLGVARAGLPVRMGNGAPPSPVAQATGATSAAGAAASRASLPTWGGMRAISAAVAVLALQGIRPREASSLRRPRSLPGQARACSRIARGTDASPPLRHAGSPRARTQAPSTSSPHASARPFPGTRPGPRPSAPGPPGGARPRQDAAPRPDEGRERPPAPAEGASAGGRTCAPRAHGRDDGRPRAGGPGDPLGPGPRPVAGDLGRLGGRQRREAAPRDPASPRPTGRGRSRRRRHRRLSGLPVGVRSSRDTSCRHRTAPARWRAASRTQARSPVARSGPRGPPARSGGTA